MQCTWIVFFTYCKIQSDLCQNVTLNSLLTSVISYLDLCNECRMHDYRFLIFRWQMALCEYNSVEWKHVGISNFIVILCFMYCTSLSDTPSVCPGGKIKITEKKIPYTCNLIKIQISHENLEWTLHKFVYIFIYLPII